MRRSNIPLASRRSKAHAVSQGPGLTGSIQRRWHRIFRLQWGFGYDGGKLGEAE